MVDPVIRYSGPLVTIAQARIDGSPFYFTGRVCISGHIDRRYTSMKICVSCKSEQAARYRDKLPELHREQNRKRGASFLKRFGHSLNSAIERAREKLPALQNIPCPRKFRLYGMSPETFVEMYVSQDGKCKICQTACLAVGNCRDSIAIDHCHKTGVIRGLLCSTCNKGLGCFRDDQEILRNAIGYLATASTIPS